MIVTGRLCLREWSINDAQRLYEFASDPDVGPAAGWPAHRNAQESRAFIRDVLLKPETYAIVLRETETVIGNIGLKPGTDSCSKKENEPELGYWIGKDYWGNAYIPEAALALIEYARQNLHCTAIWCCYYSGNKKSKRVAEKLGFRYVRTDPQGDTLLGYSLPKVETVLKFE